MTRPNERIEEVLRATPLLRAADAATIDALARASRWHTLQRDEILFVAGSRASHVYAVGTGTLRVFTTGPGGTEPTLALLGGGDMVGELGVLDDVPRSTSVSALRRSEVVEVPARAFREAYDQDAAVARRLVALLSARMRAINDGFTDLASLDLGGRMAKYLLGESERQGTRSVRLTLTQSELGQLLGGARQTVNQVMQGLERAGLVSAHGRTVEILDAEGLQRRAAMPGGRFN